MEEKKSLQRQEEEAATIPLFVYEITLHGYKRVIKRLTFGLCAGWITTVLLLATGWILR